jgi:hypothetical protein
MFRLRYLFAAVLLILAIPVWRFLEIPAAFISGHVESILLTWWFGVFIIVPVILIVKKLHRGGPVIAFLVFAVIAFTVSPLSDLPTKDDSLNQCGYLTYTGTFYPIRMYLTDAHRDDLKARNQLCWLKKVYQQMPDKLDYVQSMKILYEILLKPQIRYRSSLPLITWQFIDPNLSQSEREGAPSLKEQSSISFWKNQYTEEISKREYPWWNWPHSSYIKWEYRKMERELQKNVELIKFTTQL